MELPWAVKIFARMQWSVASRRRHARRSQTACAVKVSLITG